MAITLPKLKTENKTISAFIVPMIFVIHLHTFIGNTMSKNFSKNKLQNSDYSTLIEQIVHLSEAAKASAIKSVDTLLVKRNWLIGQHIVEFEQKGQNRAKYGEKLIPQLARDLSLRVGKGFSRSGLANMRLFYIRFQIFQTLSGKLSWSHCIELISIENDSERAFYCEQSAIQKWSVRQLRNEIDRGLFYRTQLSTNSPQKNVKPSAKFPSEIIKSAYLLDFLNMTEPIKKESSLENALVSHMEQFLLELGKGFAFVGRQYRISIDNEDYHADLVFYHIYLKRYVIIDLKRGKVRPQDIGQMNIYLGYFAMDVNIEGDNPPIGVILGSDKNDVMVKYAMYGIDANLFVAKYQLYLPNIDELKKVMLKNM